MAAKTLVAGGNPTGLTDPVSIKWAPEGALNGVEVGRSHHDMERWIAGMSSATEPGGVARQSDAQRAQESAGPADGGRS